MNRKINTGIACLTALWCSVCLVSCNTGREKNNDMEITWSPLTTEGLQDSLAKGVSASYAALIDNRLIVSGGANFPGKPGYEGGTKAFYNEIMLLNTLKNRWTVAGHLSQPSAYGVSVPLSDGFLWAGGNNGELSFSSCNRVILTKEDEVQLSPLPDLPVAMDNFAGAAIGDLVFVGGGNVNGSPSNALYAINLKTDSAWAVLPAFPGTPRVQPLMAAVEDEGKIYVYLLGGFFGGDATQKPAMATTVWRYDISTEEWTKAADQIDPATQRPFSLGGATAMPVHNRYILCLGGVHHDIFLDAITTQYNIAHNPTLSVEEKGKQLQEFSKRYLTQPVAYYRFNPECRVFDTQTGRWTTIDSTSNVARAGATLVSDGSVFYAVQGELKPGVRSPETWKGEIK